MTEIRGDYMHTLFDFLTHTKAVAYTLAGGFLVTFVLFWLFLTAREREPVVGTGRLPRPEGEEEKWR